MSKTLKCLGPRHRFLFRVPIIALSLESVTREVGCARVIVAMLESIAHTAHVHHLVHPTEFASTAYAIAPEAIPAPLVILPCVGTIAQIMVNAYPQESVSAAVNTAERIVPSLFSIA